MGGLCSSRFNSRTPGGVRRYPLFRSCSPRGFQFTHPGRGATNLVHLLIEIRTVSIHAPREGCDLLQEAQTIERRVSIHAPREGCDWYGAQSCGAPQSFNSRTPGGVRRDTARAYQPTGCFNSRTPGGVRLPSSPEIMWLIGFNSRTPGGVRLKDATNSRGATRVSIHAPREGCDLVCARLFSISVQFQFTHPGRGATARIERVDTSCPVSIHAPREGCDESNGLSPHDVRVSIHAPREGCDLYRSVRVVR